MTGRPMFEELDRQQTRMGEISLRRRLEPTLQVEVHEARLDDEFLMSSLFTVAEIELALLGLAAVDADDLDVVVGGLGLGYTAKAVLDDPRVRSLTVVDALGEVIGWHERHLVPLGGELTADHRCRLVEGDFFELVATGQPLAPGADRLHAVLVDIDHTPRHVLHASHVDFYTADGLRRLERRLQPGGVFGLWSDDPPDDDFLEVLSEVFATAAAHVVTFPNPHTDGQSANTVYVCTTADRPRSEA
jgi:spermidine synthase